MKILLVSDAYYPYPSGVTEYVYNVAKYLRERKHKVDILTLHYDDEKKERDVYRIGYCKFFNLNGTNVTLPWGLSISNEIKNFLREHKYNVIHLNGPFWPNISHFALKHAKAPIVSSFLSVTSGFTHIFSPLYRILFHNINRKIDVKIGISPVAINFIKPFFPGDYRFIPVGIDRTRFNPDAGFYEPMRTEKDTIKVLFMGRLDKRKGLDILIKALSRLNGMVNYKLFVGGNSKNRREYEEMAKKLNVKTKFLGFIPNEDMGKVYSSADIYVSPAKGGETYGIVLVEAMSSGVPVIASNIKGYATVVKDGYNGILTDVNPTAFANTIERLANSKDERMRLRENGLKYAENIDWKKVIILIEKAYTDAIDMHGRRR
ncbi:MAG: glycosyltransferase [Proteobacteria bacterium]|nr:glycosyltransferase [Pseudomonadota bacterium]